MFFFIGIPCGLAHQECPLSWTVLFLPHQVVLHLQYSYHSPICSRFQSLCYLTDVVCEICRKFYRQFVGCLVRCWRWPSLPYWRIMLLFVTAWNTWTHFRRSPACYALHLFHAWILRIFLKNLDRCLWLLC